MIIKHTNMQKYKEKSKGNIIEDRQRMQRKAGERQKVEDRESRTQEKKV